MKACGFTGIVDVKAMGNIYAGIDRDPPKWRVRGFG